MKFVSASQLFKSVKADPATHEFGKVFADLLGVKDCGDPDCEIHGNQEQVPQTWITQRDRDEMNSDDLLNLGITSATDASNYLSTGRTKEAELYQMQSLVWMQLYQAVLKADVSAELKSVFKKQTEQPEPEQPEPEDAE